MLIGLVLFLVGTIITTVVFFYLQDYSMLEDGERHRLLEATRKLGRWGDKCPRCEKYRSIRGEACSNCGLLTDLEGKPFPGWRRINGRIQKEPKLLPGPGEPTKC